MSSSSRPETIDEYIAGFSPEVREIPKRIREKGNLQFPLDKPVPYDLIERIVKHRVQIQLPS